MGKRPDTRIGREQQTVARMIRIYCRWKEGNRALCPDCEALTAYAAERLSRCPFGEHKTSCRKCTVHCYRSDMRERIREVMRYSGPRMLLFSPVAAVRHIVDEMR